MKRSIFMLSVFFFVGIFTVYFFEYQVYAHKNDNHHKSEPKRAECTDVQNQLNACNNDLNSCNEDLSACEASTGHTLPGDGYGNPDTYGVSGHGPALSYTDNGDGTFTDNHTGLMWEKKGTSPDIHNQYNIYSWSSSGTAADGMLFNGTSTIV